MCRSAHAPWFLTVRDRQLSFVPWYVDTAMPETPNADLLGTWSRLAGAAIASAADFWGRGVEIGARYASAMAAAARSADRRNGAAGARHLAAELIMLPGLAVGRFGAALEPTAARAAEPEVSGPVDGRSVVFPLRVLDASEGLVVYPVSLVAAQALLDERHHGDLVAVDLGRGRSALEIYVVDYRVTDLGTYRELGVALFAAPRTRPRQMGLAVVEEPVSGSFACRVGVELLGDPKTEARLDFMDGPTSRGCTLIRSGSGTRVLAITVPRGGTGASTDIPYTLYSRPGDRLHTMQLRRTGRGERVVAGGAGVTLVLHDDADPLSRALRTLGALDAEPMLHEWTERMSAQVSRPVPVA